MSRHTSRSLIGVLTVTLVVGGSVYWLTHRGKAVGGTTAEPATAKPVQQVAVGPAQGSATKPPEPRKASYTTPPATGDKPTTRPADRPGPVSPVATNRTAVMDGKAKIDAGDQLGGRKILNDALLSGGLSPADTATAKQLISDVNKTLIFSPQRLSNDPWVGAFTVPPGGVMQKIAASNELTGEFLCRVNGLADARKLRAGANIKVVHGPFHVVVTKHTFTMDVYLGAPGEKNALFVLSYPVGLGKDDSTPTGTWMVERRVPNPKYYSPRGEGVIEPGDPKNPLGKYWIALTGTDGNAVGKTSYGIHGNIDPDSIGKMASMGCIRMRNEDVALVYELLVPQKSLVVVRD